MDKALGTARRAKSIRSLELKHEIEDLIEAGQYELAVILTQTLLEVRLEADLHAFADEFEEPKVLAAAIDLLPGFNLSNGRVRKFVEALIGNPIMDHDEADHWARLRNFQQLRNTLVHQGAREVAASDADGFLDAVLAITRIVRTNLLITVYAYEEEDAEYDARWVSRRSKGTNGLDVSSLAAPVALTAVPWPISVRTGRRLCLLLWAMRSALCQRSSVAWTGTMALVERARSPMISALVLSMPCR